eukprot:m.307070 g.307070  ORF g.307070 m.307070 type:complete len:701 (+) comp19691_c0_seq1:125-2227(+)
MLVPRAILFGLLALALAASPGVGFEIFASLSTHEDVAVFGRNIPLGRHPANTLATSATLCTVGGKIPHQQVPLEEFTQPILCLFDGRIRTALRHVVVQIVRCEHPPEELREELYGRPVTLLFRGDYSANSTAIYERPPPPPPPKSPGEPRQSKPYRLCACLQLWYRAEFLLEWLEYNMAINGVERVFVYDNDSGIDRLKEMVQFLQRGYPVDIFDWPLAKTQPAFNGHCILRAQRECEWLMITDIDEYVVVDPSMAPDGRLITALTRLSPQLGGILVRMTNFHDDQCRIQKPLGGVVKNYNCFHHKAANTKPILRPHAIHPSLYTTPHYVCYAFPYAVERINRGIRLFHYKSQAWEVLLKKYMRRAGLGTRKYTMDDGSEASIDRPSSDFLKQCNCLREKGFSRTTALFDRFICKQSRRAADSGCLNAFWYDNADKMPPGDLLITGVGGTGSAVRGIRGWVIRHAKPMLLDDMLAQSHADAETTTTDAAVTRDGVGTHHVPTGRSKHVAVGWEFASRSPAPWEVNHDQNKRFRKVVHLVQHPLRAIAAATTLSEEEWQFIELETRIVRQSLPLLQRALYHWITWTQKIDFFADTAVRAEDARLDELCRSLELYDCPALGAEGDDMVLGNHLFPADDALKVTWDLLHEVDPFATHLARSLAAAYGYDLSGDGFTQNQSQAHASIGNNDDSPDLSLANTAAP